MASKRRDDRGSNGTHGSRGSLVALVKSAPPRPIEERGRVLYAEDVIELLATSGRTVSRWWVNHRFAPEHAFKVGRANAWWQMDALKWLDAQTRRPA